MLRTDFPLRNLFEKSRSSQTTPLELVSLPKVDWVKCSPSNKKAPVDIMSNDVRQSVVRFPFNECNNKGFVLETKLEYAKVKLQTSTQRWAWRWFRHWNYFAMPHVADTCHLNVGYVFIIQILRSGRAHSLIHCFLGAHSFIYCFWARSLLLRGECETKWVFLSPNSNFLPVSIVLLNLFLLNISKWSNHSWFCLYFLYLVLNPVFRFPLVPSGLGALKM